MSITGYGAAAAEENSDITAKGVAISPFLAVAFLALGLVVLQVTKKSALTKENDALSLLARFGAVLGTLSLFVGLVFQSVPNLLGVASDVEGRSAALVQCVLCWFVWVLDSLLHWDSSIPFDVKQCALCAAVWIGTTLVSFGGPRPYDNMSDGFDTQIAGCDGGYRSPFLCYSSLWLGCIFFGILLMLCEKRQFVCLVVPWAEPNDKTSKDTISNIALPMIYAFTTSMSGLSFTVGAASGNLLLIVWGSLLIIVAVLACWDCLWRVEMPLATWAALSQAMACLAHLAQTHLAFRDLRWDPPLEKDWLTVKRMPGLPMCCVGFAILVVTLLIMLENATRTDSRYAEKQEAHEVEDEDDDEEEDIDSLRAFMVRFWTVIKLFMLTLCTICFLLGVSLPLLKNDFTPPAVVLGKVDHHDQGIGGHKGAPNSKSLLQTIDMTYTNQLPCTAMVLIFQFIVVPPLQFFAIGLMILKPSWFPKYLYPIVLRELKNQAPMRLTNPFLAVTFVGLCNLSIAESTGDIFRMDIGIGVYFMLGYGFTSIILVSLLEADAIEVQRKERARATRHEVRHDDIDRDSESSSDVDSEEENAHPNKCNALLVVSILPILLCAVYCALEWPIFTIEFRVANGVVNSVEPTMHQTYDELSKGFPMFARLAWVTCIGTLVLWSILVLIRLPFAAGFRCDCFGVCNFMEPRRISSRAEQLVRPWVLTHVWALCFFLLYYISWARNKAVVEVCVKLPSSLTGLVALSMVYGGLLLAFGRLNVMARGPDKDHKASDLGLPGGKMVWMYGLSSTVVILFIIFYLIGPTNPAGLQTFQDINTMLEALTPFASNQLKKKLPHSAGDCMGRWGHLVSSGQAVAGDLSRVNADCKGNKPIYKGNAGGANVTVRWLEGLDTLRLKDMIVQPPLNKDPNALQHWNLTMAAHFTGLHVWIKIVLGSQTWVDDYMCCDNPFHLQIRASAMCTNEKGFFSPLNLEVSKLDPFDFKHKTNYQDQWGNSVGINVDYGKKDSIQAQVRKAFKDSVTKFRIVHPDGRVTDPLATMADLLNGFVQSNTGQKCPHYAPTHPIKLV